MRMGGGAQQFGVDSEDVPALVHGLQSGGVDVLGYHVFAGSQNLHADILAQAVDQTADLVLRLAAEQGTPLRYANLGGGFGIPYYATDSPLDIGPVAEALHVARDRLRASSPEVRLIVELGRYLVGEAGVYVTRVVDRKVSRGTTYLVVDGGMHHQMAASGNFGQVIRRNYPVRLGGPASRDPEVVQVVGCLCTPLDLLGDRVELDHAEVDDLLVVHQAGAYGLTASPTMFLSHPAPLEVLV
jgi:diaminopimelate decarboxylase